jgi:hypothetical protein
MEMPRIGSALADAKAVAANLGVGVGWVYEHPNELGPRRLGSGPKARLRFSLAEIDSHLTACPDSRRSSETDSCAIELEARRRFLVRARVYRRRTHDAVALDLSRLRRIRSRDSFRQSFLLASSAKVPSQLYVYLRSRTAGSANAAPGLCARPRVSVSDCG